MDVNSVLTALMTLAFAGWLFFAITAVRAHNEEKRMILARNKKGRR